MSNKEYTKILLEKIQAVLEPHGFHKKGATFTRTIGDDMILLVNLQKSRSSDSRSVRATVNLGVFSFVVSRDCTRPELWSRSLNYPSVWDCHWRERIGFLMPQKSDRWWEAQSVEEAARAGEEIAAALTLHGLPALGEVASTDRLRALWERGNSPGLTDKQREEYLVALDSPEQWQDEGSRRLREALARLDARSAE
jgi:hypothetical protein